MQSNTLQNYRALETVVFPVSVGKDKYKSLLLTADAVLLLSKKAQTPEEFMAIFEKGGLLLSKETLRYDQMRKIRLRENSDKLNIGNTEIEFADAAEAQKVLGYLEQATGFRREEATVAPLNAMAPSLWGLFITGVVGWVLHMEAQTLEAGGVIEISGRRAGTKRIFAEVAGMLGTTGVLAVTAVVIALFVYLAWKKYNNPPMETRLEGN